MRDTANSPHGFSKLASDHRLFAGLGETFHSLFFPFNLPAPRQLDIIHTDIEVLILDSNVNDASMTTNLVRASRYASKRVLKTCVPDVIHHLRKTRQFSPNRQILALVDLAAPDYMAIDFVQELNKDESLGSVPICILSSSKRQEDVQKAIELNALGYMVKPNDLTQCQNMSKALDQLLVVLFKQESFENSQFFQHSFEIATNGFPSAMPNSDNFFNTVL